MWRGNCIEETFVIHEKLNLSGGLEEILDGWVSSLKIVGALKDIDYVKNTVDYYRKKIDLIFT